MSARALSVASAFFLVLLGLSAPAPPARAAPHTKGPSARGNAELQQLRAEAKKASREQRFDDAISALRRADELEPSAQGKLDLARALVRKGALTEASDVLDSIAEAAAGGDPGSRKLASAAQKTQDDLTAR